MRVLYWIVRRDLLRFLADRNGALSTVAMPIVLGALLGFLFGPSKGTGAVELLVVDPVDSALTQRFVDSLKQEQGLEVAVVDEATARRQVEQGKAPVALLLPKDAAAGLTPGALFGAARPVAQLLHDPSKEAELALAGGLISKRLFEQSFSGFSDPKVLRDFLGSVRLGLSLAGEPQWTALLDQGIALADADAARASGPPTGGGGLEPPIRLEAHALTAGGAHAGYDSMAHQFAGMLCMFLLFWGQRAAVSVLRDRESGVLDRVRMCPAPPWALLVGSGLSSAAVALAVSALVYAVAILVFGVRVHGSAVAFGLVLVALAVLVGGFTLLLAGVARTEAQLENAASFIILVMSFLGGAWMPSFVLPSWVQTLSLALPVRWATEGLAATTWRGLGLMEAMPWIGLLGATGVALGTLGVMSFRWAR